METVAITAPIVNGICTPSVLQIYEKTEHTMRGKEKTENENLPVLLWIHGGGYTIGYAANAGGPNFVSSSNGSIVFVSIQYRLGAYGFLASDEVAESGTPNAALLDQRAAIDWVQRHISAFGGDPSKVCAIV